MYAALGDLQYFLDDFLLINARYTHQVSLLDSPGSIWASTLKTYGWTTWVLLGGLAVELVLAVRARRAARSGDPRAAALVGMGALTVVGILWSLLAYNGWPDCFFAFPVVVVGIAGLVPVLRARLPAPVLRGVVAVWLVAVVVLTTVYAIRTREQRAGRAARDVEAVLRVLPDARIMSVEAPPPLVLAHQRNPTRFQLFGNGLEDYVQDTWPGGQDGLRAAGVDQHAPDLLAVGTESGVPPWLTPVLASDFVEVGGTPGWTWYVRPEVGQDKVDRLRQVLGG